MQPKKKRSKSKQRQPSVVQKVVINLGEKTKKGKSKKRSTRKAIGPSYGNNLSPAVLISSRDERVLPSPEATENLAGLLKLLHGTQQTASLTQPAQPQLTEQPVVQPESSKMALGFTSPPSESRMLTARSFPMESPLSSRQGSIYSLADEPPPTLSRQGSVQKQIDEFERIARANQNVDYLPQASEMPKPEPVLKPEPLIMEEVPMAMKKSVSSSSSSETEAEAEEPEGKVAAIPQLTEAQKQARAKRKEIDDFIESAGVRRSARGFEYSLMSPEVAKKLIDYQQSEKFAGKDFMSGSHQRVFRQGRTVLEGQKLKQAEQPKQAEEPPKPKKQPKKAELPKQPPLKDPRPEQGRVLSSEKRERYDKRYTEKMAMLMKKNQTLRNQGRVPQSHLAMTKEADEYAMFSGPSGADEL